MNLRYLPLRFNIHFDEPVVVDNNPLFVLRGVFGNNLRKMCCVSRKDECSTCMFNQSCVYSVVFETILKKEENNVLPGTDRASHPFSFTDGDLVQTGTKIQDYSFTITLFGKTIDYLPYVYAAFVRAGENGLFQSRIHYSVKNIFVQNSDILLGENKINTEIKYENIEIKNDDSLEEYAKDSEITLRLVTPLRFKTNGVYSCVDDFSSIDLFRCFYRRFKNLFLLYGDDVDFIPEYKETKTKIVRKDIRWSGDKRYSARQKNTMYFCGYEGSLTIKGPFTKFEFLLIKIAEIANAGKNTNFGLGRVK